MTCESVTMRPVDLPRPGTEWPKAKKDRFMIGFRGILDIVYPDPEEQT